MNDPAAPAAARPAAVVAIAAAVIAAIALLLVAVAVALGWLPWDAGLLPHGRAEEAREPATAAHIRPIPVPEDPAQRPDPLMPRYTQPTPPPAAPPRPRDEADRARAEIFAARPRMIPPPQIERPMPGPAPAPPAEEPGPATPSYARAPRAPDPEPRGRRGVGLCEECGRVMRVTMYPGGVWELRVEFEDGSLRIFRSRRRPPFGAGEHVRLEDDYLIRD